MEVVCISWLKFGKAAEKQERKETRESKKKEGTPSFSSETKLEGEKAIVIGDGCFPRLGMPWCLEVGCACVQLCLHSGVAPRGASSLTSG